MTERVTDIDIDDVLDLLDSGHCKMSQSVAAKVIRQLQGDLKTVLDREAATYKRHDDRMAECEAREARMRGVCEPFRVMAGEMFARNWNKDQVAVSLGTPVSMWITFEDFLNLHATLGDAS